MAVCMARVWFDVLPNSRTKLSYDFSVLINILPQNKINLYITPFTHVLAIAAAIFGEESLWHDCRPVGLRAVALVYNKIVHWERRFV